MTQVDPVQRKRELKAAHRCNQILDAAKAVFQDADFGAVNVEDIATASGLSRATIYQYFGSKQDIYTALLLRDLGGMVDGLKRSLVETDTVKNNLFRMTMSYMNFFHEHQEYFRSLSFFYLPGRKESLSPEAAEQVRIKLDEGIATIERAIALGIERQEARPMDARAATLSLWGQWMGCAYLAATGRIALYERTSEQVYANSIEIFLDGLLAA
ncbi:TetR/AcrR family transcriptional regulator [Enterovirga rhinocerotis]|uniref:TetR family transcriptional regulator n=1 Tax=Enterovirga rhinocerotis TaxID=1339210 RepID=A0A4R7C3H5_9HYPH|nr:TetR/AcrR family transcriptional regulator [Enterovirga rhinocerotis]TDR92984.1 TetR family transcriptional regulator [Enterovirga rhinocerotis]